MLVLTRKLNEAIHLGGDIKVTVVDLHNGKVRLGVEAPATVAVFRTGAPGEEPWDLVEWARRRGLENRGEGP
jgi:hypothetical protein